MIHGIGDTDDPGATLAVLEPWSKGVRNSNDLADESRLIKQQLYLSEEEDNIMVGK